MPVDPNFHGVNVSAPGAGFPWSAVGDLAGSAADLLFADGGLFGSNQGARDRQYAAALNEYNAGRQEYWNYANIDMQRESNAQTMRMFDIARQDAAERNAIADLRGTMRWRMEDAASAGVHPLMALGANTGGSGGFVVGSPSLGSSPGIAERMDLAPSGGLRDWSGHGQNLARAAAKILDKEGRAEAQRLMRQQLASNALDLEYKELSNRKLLSEISALDRSQVGPATPGVQDVPNYRTMEGQRGTEAGDHVATGWSKLPDGSYSRVPSMDEKNRIEDMGPLPWMWTLDNVVVPFFDKRARRPPPSSLLKPGHRWIYRGGRYFQFPNDTKYRSFDGEQ